MIKYLITGTLIILGLFTRQGDLEGEGIVFVGLPGRNLTGEQFAGGFIPAIGVEVLEECLDDEKRGGTSSQREDESEENGATCAFLLTAAGAFVAHGKS